MDPDEELTRADIVNDVGRAPAGSRCSATTARSATRAQIARAIVRARDHAPLETTNELVEVVAAAIPAPARFAGGHPAKRVFQAIRIAVNDELGAARRGASARVGAPPRRMADLQGFPSIRWKTAA